MRVIASIFVIINLLAVGLQPAYSQKIYAAKGFAKIRLEEHLSREETRDMASEQAKHNAIEAIFGTYVSKDAFVDVKDGAASVTVKSESELKGEWLKTTKEEFREESRRIKDEYGARNEIWIICEVEGKVREITSAVIAYEFLTLNCPDVRCRTTDFNNGESLFLQFRTPVDGYMSIYLVDEQHAYRLLPYQEMPSAYLHNVPVEADREYLFFAAGIQYDYFDKFPYFLVDEIYLDTDKTQEFYKLYVLFSPKPFAKPILENEVEVAGAYTTPKTLRRSNFDVWVQDNRIFNTDFFFKTLNVRVRQ
ncbi:MAG: hypothetical protein IH947_00975 [Bacteroidetes bacterium]|nr:hypothetical protein [Bacteroidota bacterium]